MSRGIDLSFSTEYWLFSVALAIVQLLVFTTFSVILCRDAKKRVITQESAEPTLSDAAIKHLIPGKVKSTADMYDAGEDAKIRHDAHLALFPKLKLQTESITNENYRTAKKRLGYTQHTREEQQMKFEPKPKNPNAKVKFAKTCLVYIVYEEDSTRGEVEKEELTADSVVPVDESQVNAKS